MEDFKNYDDEELVFEIIESGNTFLFGELYNRFSDRVYSRCLNFSVNKEEAQDLTHDIFVNLYLKIKSFKGKSKFSTWLYVFTYHHCVNYVKRDKESKIFRSSAPVHENEKLLIEVDDYSLFQLKITKLKKAMNLLSAEEKMLLMLKYQDDMSIYQLTQHLNIGESAVKMRVKRAKARLVQIYREKI